MVLHALPLPDQRPAAGRVAGVQELLGAAGGVGAVGLAGAGVGPASGADAGALGAVGGGLCCGAGVAGADGLAGAGASLRWQAPRASVAAAASAMARMRERCGMRVS
ncbi:hypothetical protein GCM10007320_29030 [Pseudorhodoferax aquiterrae]|uniref:Uncharacterized protein n=1 Tax=Pseudorhodoferax aquiterrae TaxID=747304 RepID=A0ABQ3G349_9BURK|nr:hypothetical protein GCM10007320_29030 [Pseudorhodoferax aquiterrae]